MTVGSPKKFTLDRDENEWIAPNDLGHFAYEREFTLDRDENGWITWKGAGEFENVLCGMAGYREVKEAAADAVFWLAIADGYDWSEALSILSFSSLPSDHIDLKIFRFGS